MSRDSIPPIVGISTGHGAGEADQIGSADPNFRTYSARTSGPRFGFSRSQKRWPAADGHVCHVFWFTPPGT
jgi:hypothetical protein